MLNGKVMIVHLIVGLIKKLSVIPLIVFPLCKDDSIFSKTV